MQTGQLTDVHIEQQRERVFGKQPEIKLLGPCKLGNGILHLLQVQRDNLIHKFDHSDICTSFFIPASGSGSRMFQFLYDFVNSPNEENRGQIERFLNYIEDFPFFQKLPSEVRKKLRSHDVNLEEFIHFLLNDQETGLGSLPKGLIPFHKNGPFVLNPFQEHILQGTKIKEEKAVFHFTVHPDYIQRIQDVIHSSEILTGNKYDVRFSVQNETSNAIAFDANGNLASDEHGKVITRPAGHGALLENLNTIQSDLIFIKNIDNVQHYAKSKESVETWKYLGGIALWFDEERTKLFNNPSLEDFIILNRTFQIIPEEEAAKAGKDDIIRILNRPFRVCGMVRNEGQPGGGPFWIEEDGKISKQIVEKSQISMNPHQYNMMVQSSYFNPVMIAAMNKDKNGLPFDLAEFCDENKFFVVKKKHKGKDIRFAELPGLWNGSMAYWNSIFVEVPSTTFSPVKTVLDLLDNAHRE